MPKVRKAFRLDRPVTLESPTFGPDQARWLEQRRDGEEAEGQRSPLDLMDRQPGAPSAQDVTRAWAQLSPRPALGYLQDQPLIDRTRFAKAPNPGQIYSYDGRDFPSFESAKAAHPEMARISNPPDPGKAYQARRDRAFVDSIGSGALGLGTMCYAMGGSPETIQAGTDFDEALGNLAAGAAMRPGHVKFPAINPATPRAQIKAWPENDGFSYSLTTQLRPGDLMDRYGAEGSQFVAPLNTPFEARGIDPRKKGDGPHVYEVLEPMDVPGGPAMPWYGHPGGGVQYKLPATVQDLISNKKLGRRP